jgi:hypothetical protein
MEKRIIKFRAWDKEHKKMIYEIPLATVNFYGSLEEFFKYTELMQYTGLEDKNGKEIYEGDILFNPNDRYEYYEVRWNSKEACFELGDDGSLMSKYGLASFWGISGNIYENPELISK